MKGISVLIPVYEYNPGPLLTVLHKQCSCLSITFEIIVFDDGSNIDTYYSWKRDFDAVVNLHVYRSEKNIGRAAIRNELIKKASCDWLLFLDADTMPCTNTYIQHYLPFLNTINTCICGGTAYRKTPPPNDQLLRWIYGCLREEIPAVKRNTFPFDTFTLNNLLIRKEIVLKFPLDGTIQTYGHEDTLLGMILAENGLKIQHIDNFVFHEGLDSNDVFLHKVIQSVKTLADLYVQHKLPAETKLIRLHRILRMFKLNRLVYTLLKSVIPSIEKNLLSSTPSLFYMDLLKLWYFENCLNH